MITTVISFIGRHIKGFAVGLLVAFLCLKAYEFGKERTEAKAAGSPHIVARKQRQEAAREELR